MSLKNLCQRNSGLLRLPIFGNILGSFLINFFHFFDAYKELTFLMLTKGLLFSYIDELKVTKMITNSKQYALLEERHPVDEALGCLVPAAVFASIIVIGVLHFAVTVIELVWN